MYISTPKTYANSVPSVFSVLNLRLAFAPLCLGAFGVEPAFRVVPCMFRLFRGKKSRESKAARTRTEIEPKANRPYNPFETNTPK
jgi:hypothetical protein